MKILHTADWHIGKLVHGMHMTGDQEYVLDGLVQLLKKEQPDVLVIAGDVYDRSVPPVEAVELLDGVLTTIVADLDIEVIMISGNHDSPDRLGFAGKILEKNGLHITGEMEAEFTPVILGDGFGKVAFHVIPYSDPAHVKALLGNEDIRTHDQAFEAIMERIREKMDRNMRSVCVTHGYVAGLKPLEESDSERPLSIGGTEMVSVEHLKEFDYVALGHIHGPQKVKYDHVRYSGSLLKYSFSETRQRKSVTMVEMDADGSCDIRLIEIEPRRDMRIIKGTLEQLLNDEVYKDTEVEDYIKVVLTDRGELVDAIAKLRSVYPNLLHMEFEQYEKEAGDGQTSASKEFIRKHPVDLFSEFYENVTGQAFDADKRDYVIEISDALFVKEGMQ